VQFDVRWRNFLFLSFSLTFPLLLCLGYRGGAGSARERERGNDRFLNSRSHFLLGSSIGSAAEKGEDGSFFFFQYR